MVEVVGMVAFVGSGDQPAAALGSRVALGLGVAEVAAGRGPPLGEAPPRATSGGLGEG
jgi:hypothetical protein